MSKASEPTHDASALLDSIVIETKDDGRTYTALDAVKHWHADINSAEVHDECQ